MEAIEPRKIWILKPRYEVTIDEIIGLADILLSSPKDTTKERFITYENSIQVYMDQRQSQIKKIVDKMTAQFEEEMGLTKKQVVKENSMSRSLRGSASVRRFGIIATTLVVSNSSNTMPLTSGSKRKETSTPTKQTSAPIKENISPDKQKQRPKKKKVASTTQQTSPVRRRVKTKATREQYLGVNVEDGGQEGPKLVQKRKYEASQGEASSKKLRMDIVDIDEEAQIQKEKQSFLIHMREKKAESSKMKTLEENKNQKKKPSVRTHSPMKLDALLNGIVQNEMIEKTIALYVEVDEVEKATIIEAIVKYIFFKLL